ncbi:HDIG domain-containing protein [bacterium]|nr:HDIG domain-containing protein [bacterium]
MTREEAMSLVNEQMSNKNLIKHVLGVEAIMRHFALRLGENVDVWGLAGLLHDLDYDKTKDNPSQHSLMTAEILTEQKVSSEIIQAVKGHNDLAERVTKMDWALYAADPVSGFIVACTLIHPTKKLASIDLAFMQKKFKTKRFAAGASREQMAACEKIGLDLEAFLCLSLEAMQLEHVALGL